MKKTLNILKTTIAIVFATLLIMDLIRPITHWPKVELYYTPTQAVFYKTISISNYLGKWSAFAYFTVLSNIIATTGILLSWVFRFKIKSRVRLMILTYMIITSLVFWTSLAPLLPWGQSAYFDFDSVNQHLVALIVTAWWAFSDKDEETVKYKYVWIFLFPVLYFIFNLMFYIFTTDHIVIYPFLKFDNWFSYNFSLSISITCTILSIVGIAILFILIYWLCLKLFKIIQLKQVL
ncbi:hypothetical protein [Candidatus Mycoplasma mahonii]|uniref:hypothetical protein n=1 Tax=Candidatus Mycoplasma mahonii TaxID=3004105 RepID=UPI0026EF9E50|nr:hypothetical protein [Candidatus Mycoplasma mahonii]WKX02294.1 hypothetical protein O3I44_02720 [Candidatus Mycoplasma mahonii]